MSEELIASLTERLQKRCDEHGLEAHSLIGYVINGWQPGGFLTAVLENKLVEAATRADDHNMRRLYGWAVVMYNDVPRDARGSPEAVAKWLRHGGLRGLMAPAEAVS